MTASRFSLGMCQRGIGAHAPRSDKQYAAPFVHQQPPLRQGVQTTVSCFRWSSVAWASACSQSSRRKFVMSPAQSRNVDRESLTRLPCAFNCEFWGSVTRQDTTTRGTHPVPQCLLCNPKINGQGAQTCCRIRCRREDSRGSSRLLTSAFRPRRSISSYRKTLCRGRKS